ncbi:hypothetical protein HMPREF0391_11195 [Finegoldia magna ATCC 53516]|uniref:Uncharacterized protein n=1 Tax=Finegoldia magna ATCC 53516 TaxID=525282 RepID=D6S9Q9_FINMA|nr:hypothetical protein HMPREF0391_11195 [Finegoldia magna ATCC 53516]
MPKLGYKYLNFQILVIKVYFLKIKKISAHNLSGGADTQNFSHTLFPVFLFSFRWLGDERGVTIIIVFAVELTYVCTAIPNPA